MENEVEDPPSHLGNAKQIELYQHLNSRAHRKHFEANRSKYRNPDLPVGFLKTEPKITYKDALKMDGQYYYYLNLAYEKSNNVFQDLEGFSDLELSSPDEEAEEEEPPSVEIKIKKELTEEEEDKKRKTHKQKGDVTTSRKIKKEQEEEHKKKSSKSRKDSDSDSPHKKSPPPPPMLIKEEESQEPPEHLYGHYHCDVCNITMNSLLTYNTHVNGKKHLKNLKLKNIPEAVAKTIPSCASEADSKYPRPPKGVMRMKVKERAKIQEVMEKQVKVPCPGLGLVIEIQGMADTQYYCLMCDSVCSPNSIIPHLTGFKHQMKSIKHFKPDTYEDIKNLPKYKVDKRIMNILRGIEHREGLGIMLVEKDILSSEPTSAFDEPLKYEGSSNRRHDMQSTSSRDIGLPFDEKYSKTTIPDMSHSDFYCPVCQSHMNSQGMWEMHIRGKRHLANIKKVPGTRPSKTRTIQVPGARAFLLERLENEDVREPIVGLNQIQEVQIPETKSETYQCFLCGACLSSIDIIEHLLTVKHRQKYLDHIDFPGREVVKGMREPSASILVAEMCAEVEGYEGRGNPSVHVTKSALTTSMI